MYSAKAAGRNTYQFFTPELREQTSERLQVIDELRLALESGDQLELAYQPKVNAIEPSIIGAKALARWNHPTLWPGPAFSLRAAGRGVGPDHPPRRLGPS